MSSILQDAINPAHYLRNNLECIQCIEAVVAPTTGLEAYLLGNVVKYVWRWKEKNGIEDLKKAQWYLDALIQHQPRPPANP
jgi:hypothetical protein